MSELDSAIGITSLRATVEQLFEIPINAEIDSPNPLIQALQKHKLGESAVDRVVIYNPDAVALWLYQKYTVQAENPANGTTDKRHRREEKEFSADYSAIHRKFFCSADICRTDFDFQPE